ncbi:MAG: TolC family protein, partial [Gammaproteobacteria bacterium]|nr:TolC family protein [Gammaproteobacteria bacterium]
MNVRIVGNSWIIVGVMICASPLVQAAGNSTQVTLQQAYAAALDYDAKIAVAKSVLESDQEQVGYARSFLLPNVVASASGGYGKSTVDYAKNSQILQDKTTPYFEKYSYALRLTQPVFRKNYIEGYRQAGYMQQQGELRYQSAAQDLALRVAQAYFDVLLAQSNVELADAESQATAKRLDTLKIAQSVGTITMTEVYDAQARFDLSRARAISAKSQLDIASQSLARIIGYTPQTLARWPDNFPLLAPEPSNIDSWKNAAKKENLQVLTASAGVEVARLELERQLGLVYPSLDVVASYGKNYVGDGTFGGENTAANT